jgi:hypothetical protein
MREESELIVPCPKCGRRLRASGVVNVNGRSAFSFQCDECITKTEFYGEPIEAPLTFVTDEAGTVVGGDSLPAA